LTPILDDLLSGGGGVDPPEVAAVRPIQQFHRLLSALSGGSEADFLARIAAIDALMEAGLGVFTPSDLDAALRFLTPVARRTVLKSLRDSGWIQSDSQRSTVFTSPALQLYTALTQLYRRTLPGDLGPTIEALAMSERTGASPGRALAALRNEMAEIQGEIMRALEQGTEYILLAARDKLRATLSLHDRFREVLAPLTERDRATRRAAKDALRALGQLLSLNADLEDRLTQYSRQFVRFHRGLSPEQVVQALRGMDPLELGDAARRALLGAYSPVELVQTSPLLRASSAFLATERTRPPPQEWPPAEEPVVQTILLEFPAAAVGLAVELERLAAANGEKPFREIVPEGSSSESLYRNNLLSLLSDSAGRRGLSGRFAKIPLTAVTEGDGWPEVLASGPLQSISEGAVKARRASD
jgi:hypothetical protein